MAQLNDLLVLGNTSLIGEVQVCEKITAPVFEGDLNGNATTANTATKTVAGLKIGSKTFNGSTGVEITPGDLGLSSAMKFLGTTTTAITDGAKTNPITINSVSTSVTSGNVVLYGQKEFVWTSSGAWEELGNEGSYKIVQKAVADPSTSGASTDLNYIYSITQNTNGVITPTKKTIPTATSSVLGAVKLSDAINSTSGASAGVAATPAAVKTTYDRAETKLPLAGGNMTGHIYLTGSNAGSSTANTSQLIFGTSSNEHVAISSNDNTLVINPTSSTTTNQIVLYLDSPSSFPSGLNVGANSTFSNALSVGTNLTVGNNATITNDLTVSGATSLAKALTFTGTSASASKIHFSRTNNPSYFTAGTGGYFCFVPNGQSASLETSDLIISDGTVRPGTTNVTSLGTSSYKWSNVYATKFTGSLIGNADTATKLTSSGGGATTPVYFNNGKPVACTICASGNWWGALSYIGDDGVMETGKYIDFHNSDGSTKDYSTRITCNGDTQNDLILPTKSGTIALTSDLSSYLPLSGGTMTGAITFRNSTAKPAKGTILNCIRGQYQNAAGNYYTINLVDLVASAEAGTTVSSGYARFGSNNGASFFTAGESGTTMPKALADAGTLGAENAYITADSSIVMYAGCANDAASYTKAMTVASSKVTSHVALYGAVWNDYAEFRDQKEKIQPGYCVVSANNGQVSKTTEKFQACDGIVSDTFGFAIGETDECKTPLAVAGRVLAYCEGNRYDYHSGDTVCAGPEGKVCKMTREEIKEYPDRIVGIVSEIPEYENWGSGNVKVDGRIWIKIK